MKTIFCNFSASGNEDAVDYLRKNSKIFVRLCLSFHHARSNKKSFVSKYETGKEIWKKELIAIKPNSRFLIFLLLPIIYCIHLINILRLNFLLKEKYDVFIGQNYFCSLGGIILKRIGLVKKSVYWVGDYFPIPPNGIYRFLLKIFLIIDRFCLMYADEIWFMTPRLLSIREKNKVLPKKFKNHVYKIVTTGIDTENLTIANFQNIDKKSAVFLGVLSKDQGIDKVIEVIPEILKKVPNFKLNIIGSGSYENELKLLSKNLNLEKQVIFHGFLENEKDTRKIISESGVSVAIYCPNKYGFTQFADSGKIKIYLSCGTPVIITNVPYIAEEVRNYNAGIVINYDQKELSQAMIDLLLNQKLNKQCRGNALKLAKTYNTKIIMSEALKTI